MKVLSWKTGFTDAFVLLILLVIHFFIFSIYSLFSGAFMPCGEEYLTIPIVEQEAFEEILTFGIAETLIMVIIAIVFMRNRSIVFAIGIWALPLTTIPSIVQSYKTAYQVNYYEEFESSRWKQLEQKPFTMIRTLIKGPQSFVGKSKQEVELLFGKGDPVENESKKTLYKTEGYATYWVFTYTENKLTGHEFYCHD